MEVDTCFISNTFSEQHYERICLFLGNNINDDFTGPLNLKFLNTLFSWVPINCPPDEINNKNGIIKAREFFLNALNWYIKKSPIKIVLLAASTKRLFGKNCDERVNSDGHSDKSGFTLNELYPDVLFTNGDNGTSVILNMEIDSMLEKSGILSNVSNRGAVIINGLGLLGLSSLEYLIEKGLNDNQIIVISNHTKDLKELIGNHQISIFPHIKNIPTNDNAINHSRIKVIINCTHNPSNIIDFESIKHIQNSQKLFVADVAVPYGFPENEFAKCQNIYRQDGGNAYLGEKLEFLFNPDFCGLTENVVYGCFAEAMALSLLLKDNPDKRDYLNQFDFFNVNKNAKEFIKGLFVKYGIAPIPYCYNKKIMNE